MGAEKDMRRKRVEVERREWVMERKGVEIEKGRE